MTVVRPAVNRRELCAVPDRFADSPVSIPILTKRFQESSDHHRAARRAPKFDDRHAILARED
jgi:hypothetical protein